ncbi:Peptidase [Sphingomonas paucimobilis]|nr:Peptidase [Sphingomonas paucimobilis]
MNSISDQKAYIRAQPQPVPEGAQTVQIAMRDGVELAADLYRADLDIPAATILIRTPYDKGGFPGMGKIARVFVAHGYNVVIQDVRGRFRSGGATEYMIHEPDDGYDTIDWIAKQPWSDGSVGMWGTSYIGFTQIAALSSAHPALKCIAPRLTGSNLGLPVIAPDGSEDVEHVVNRWYFGQCYNDNFLYIGRLPWHQRPWKKMMEGFFETVGQWSADFEKSFERDFPSRAPGLASLIANPIPTLFTVGYYDLCAPAAWQDIEALSAAPAWAGKLFLRLEAVDHEGYNVEQAPFGPEDWYTHNPVALEKFIRRAVDPTIPFYNRHLRGLGEGVPPVQYEVGTFGWKASEAWPPAHTRRVRFYLSGKNNAQGLLGETPPERDFARWRHDGGNLVPSIAASAEQPCGPGSTTVLMAWPDLAPLGDRPDVLAFGSKPVAADLLITGAVTLKGRLASTLESADVFARLLDQAPDGTAHLITRGQVRIKTRPVSETADGDTIQDHSTPFAVTVGQTAYKLPAGHRLLLHVFSSDFPEYTANGGGVDPWLIETVPSGTHMLEFGPATGAILDIDVAASAEAVRAAFA